MPYPFDICQSVKPTKSTRASPNEIDAGGGCGNAPTPKRRGIPIDISPSSGEAWLIRELTDWVSRVALLLLTLIAKTMNISVSNRPELSTAASPSSGSNWPYFLAFGALLLVCYWPTIHITAQFALFSEDMAHALFAPIVASYIAWNKARGLLTRELQPTAGAFVPLLLGAVIAIAGTLGSSTTVTRFASLLSLAGFFLLVGGVPVLRDMAFPLLLLLFTFPIPDVLYGEITLPLQLLASRLAESSFELLGYGVFREGNILELARQRLSVAEACSGLRSLETLGFFSLVYAFLLEPRRWLQAVILVAALPAAIMLNVVRILATGILGNIDPRFTHGIWHELLGWICLTIGFGLVFLLHWSILRLPKIRGRHR